MMVGMLVFTIVALGLTGAVLQTRRLSQLALLRNTAYTIAQGYMEQMESITASALTTAALSGPTNPIPVPTMGVSYLDMTNIQISDPLYVSPISNLTPAPGVTLQARTDKVGDVWNVKQVMVDVSGNTSYLNVNLGNSTGNTTGGVVPITMTMWIDLNISQGVTTSTTGTTSITLPAPTIIIQMDFQYQSNGYIAAGRQSGSLRIARTDVDGG
jgi:Tfp pilus assembly protein PilV